MTLFKILFAPLTLAMCAVSFNLPAHANSASDYTKGVQCIGLHTFSAQKLPPHHKNQKELEKRIKGWTRYSAIKSSNGGKSLDTDIINATKGMTQMIMQAQGNRKILEQKFKPISNHCMGQYAFISNVKPTTAPLSFNTSALKGYDLAVQCAAITKWKSTIEQKNTMLRNAYTRDFDQHVIHAKSEAPSKSSQQIEGDIEKAKITWIDASIIHAYKNGLKAALLESKCSGGVKDWNSIR